MKKGLQLHTKGMLVGLFIPIFAILVLLLGEKALEYSNLDYFVEETPLSLFGVIFMLKPWWQAFIIFPLLGGGVGAILSLSRNKNILFHILKIIIGSAILVIGMFFFCCIIPQVEGNYVKENLYYFALLNICVILPIVLGMRILGLKSQQEKQPHGCLVAIVIAILLILAGVAGYSISRTNLAKSFIPVISIEKQKTSFQVPQVLIDKYVKKINLNNTINLQRSILYVPNDIPKHKKVPLVMAFSPSGSAQSMINTWREVADKYKWIIIASKEFRNGLANTPDIIQNLLIEIDSIKENYPFDNDKMIATGFSGGGMCSYIAASFRKEIIQVVVTNSGRIHPELTLARTSPLSKNFKGKYVVLMVSPTDNNYSQMKIDKRFLRSKGAYTHWIEFQGGHTIAPSQTYLQAAKWIKEQLDW